MNAHQRRKARRATARNAEWLRRELAQVFARLLREPNYKPPSKAIIRAAFPHVDFIGWRCAEIVFRGVVTPLDTAG